MKGADYTWACGCYEFCGNLIACQRHSPYRSRDVDGGPNNEHEMNNQAKQEERTSASPLSSVERDDQLLKEGERRYNSGCGYTGGIACYERAGNPDWDDPMQPWTLEDWCDSCLMTAFASLVRSLREELREKQAQIDAAFEQYQVLKARVKALTEALELTVNACRDVTGIGRFSRAVDPVRWVANIQGHCEDALTSASSLDAKK